MSREVSDKIPVAVASTTNSAVIQTARTQLVTNDISSAYKTISAALQLNKADKDLIALMESICEKCQSTVRFQYCVGGLGPESGHFSTSSRRV